MTELSGSPVLHAGEIAGVYAYFLGSSIPTGAQTVQVNHAGGTSFLQASAISLTATNDTAIEDVGTINNASLSNPSATLTIDEDSWMGIVFASGTGTVGSITPTAGWTSRREIDWGAQTSGVYTKAANVSSNTAFGWTQAADDAAAIGFAIKENSDKTINVSDNIVVLDTVTNESTNPSFETDLSDWTEQEISSVAASLTNSRSTTQALSGTASLKLVQTTAGEDDFMRQIVTVQANTYYTVKCSYYLETYTAAALGNRGFLLFNGLGGIAGVNITDTTTGTWITLSDTIFMGSSTSLEIRLYAPQGTIYWDGILVEKGGVSHTYFDGNSTGASWNGTTNLSTSKTANYNVTVSIQTNTDLSVNKSDSITVTESVNRLTENYINKSDSITITENVAETVVNDVSTNDSIGVTESLKLLSENYINNSDSITVTESASALIPTLLVSVNDTTTLTESVKSERTSFINLSDSVTVSESVNATIPYEVSVSDSVTLTESTKLLNEANITKSDSVTITENASLLIPELLKSASDTASITESLKLLVYANREVSDSIAVSENVTLLIESKILVNDSVGVSENIQRVVEASIVKSDSVSVTDAPVVSIQTTDLFITTADSTTVAENIKLTNENQISVAENVTITESIDRLVENYINKSDSITTTESVTTLIPTLLINVSDNVAITEALNVTIASANDYSVNVSDGVTITESATFLITPLNAPVSDSVTVSESISVSIQDAQTDVLSVSDSVAISESANLLIPTLFITVNDSATVSESVSVSIPTTTATLHNLTLLGVGL